jgi:hypothetical protein
MKRWVGTREELRALICERREAVDISLSTLNSIAGTQEGYAEKLLAPDPIRNFGPESLAAILGALALRIVRVEIVEDPEAAAQVSGRWTPRKRRPRRKPADRCVVAIASGPQSAFAFVHCETEQGPDVERQTHDDDHDAR